MVVFSVQHGQGELPKTRWSVAKDAPWQPLAGKKDDSLGVLHEWARQQLVTQQLSQGRAQMLDASVAAFHSVLIMGTIR